MANVAFSPTPNVSTPAVSQQAPANTAAQAAPQNAPPPAIADSPADQALNVLRQRYPHLNDLQLTSRQTLTGPTDTRITAPVGQAGTTPIVLGKWDGANTRVALMPTSGVPGPDPNAKIQQFVRDGEALYQRITSGNAPQQPSKEEVNNVMWYLQALASSKALESSSGMGGPALFASGAMTIEDPGDRLATFFESANSYPRSSSHLTELQNAPGCRPFGVDVRGVATPNERRTVLLQRLPEGATGGKKMLFLKMEEHGCRGLSFKGTGLGPQAESQLSGWDKFARGVKRFFSNVGDFIGHAGGFFRSLAQQAGLAALPDQDNRERVDPQITKTLEEARTIFADACMLSSDCNEFTEEQLAFNEQLKKLDIKSSAGGVQLALKTVDQISDALLDLLKAPGIKDDARVTAWLEGKKNFLGAARDQITRTSGDHPELRFGREVILTADEMKTGGVFNIDHIDQSFEGGRVNRTLTLSPQDTAAWKDSMEFVANFPETNTRNLGTFERDLHRSDDFSIFIQNPGTGKVDPEPYYRSGDFNQFEGYAGQRLGAGLNALEWVFDEEGGIINAVKNLTHQGALSEMAMMLSRDLLGRYGEIPTLNNGSPITEITKRAPHPDNPNLLVCDINLSTKPFTFAEEGLNGGLRGKINTQESSAIFKAGFSLVYDTQTKRITVEVITPPTVDITLTGQDGAPSAASQASPSEPVRVVVSRRNRNNN